MMTLAGLGPGAVDQLSQVVLREMKRADVIYIRTRIHPIVEELESLGFQFFSFDWLYESADSFDELYRQIAEELTNKALRKDVFYAVPGHPLVGERSVELLLKRTAELNIPVRILPGISFVEPVLEAVGHSLSSGLKILDALSTGQICPDPDVPNIVYQLHDRFVASEVKLALLECYPPDFQIALIRAAGMPNAQEVVWLPLHDLDRRDDFDHLTTLWIPAKNHVGSADHCESAPNSPQG